MPQPRPIAASLLALLGSLLAGCQSPAVPHPAGPSPDPGTAQSVRDPAAEVLTGLRRVVAIRGTDPPLYRLDDRMRYFLVPGVSIAVADGGRIVWARGFGVQAKDTGADVTPHTPFQAASISKVVTATATLGLVDRGVLALDEDVNRSLISWHVPENELTRTEKVTLRRILSHSAGLNGFSVGGYAPGEPLPTLAQILDGLPPAKTLAIRVQSVPGARVALLGGGVTILQLLLEDVTHEPFSTLLQRLVLGPLDMQDSVFALSRPMGLEARAALGYDAIGEPAVRTAHVEMAAAGLWSTPSDLLKWAIEIAAASDGHSGPVLSRAMASAMLTRQKRDVWARSGATRRGPGVPFPACGLERRLSCRGRLFPSQRARRLRDAQRRRWPADGRGDPVCDRRRLRLAQFRARSHRSYRSGRGLARRARG